MAIYKGLVHKMKKLSKDKLKSAKTLYMEGLSIRKIAAHVDVTPGAIQYHINNGWAEERKLLRLEKMQEQQEAKAIGFIECEDYTVQIMKKALKDLAERDRPPTVAEAKQASEIMNILDKIARLDKGEATDIVSNQEKALTVETIAKKLKLDPFKPKEIEFEKVSKISD